MGALTISTWNINSVRLRAPLVTRFLSETKPDVLCLQEIKCQPAEFPERVFTDAGYKHSVVRGQKGYHGVAIVSKHPIEAVEEPGHCRHEEARVACAKVKGVEIHNYYVPAGGDEPDIAANPKFAHKLDFVERMRAQFAKDKKRFAKTPVVIVGDLNIAPYEHDVWSHKQLLKVVSHTPPETEGLLGALDAGGLSDAMRELIPEPEKIYTWWSYRNRDWRKSNRGRRLDHVWVSPALRDGALAGGRKALSIREECRDWEKPSDHVPVTLKMKI